MRRVLVILWVLLESALGALRNSPVTKSGEGRTGDVAKNREYFRTEV